MSEYMSPIPSRLYNATVGGHVAGADQIIDDETGLTLDKVAGGALEEKTYISGSDNGMGRVVLRKNLVEGVNTLTQSMINKSNTIYVIQYDFILGEDITVPADCVLEFNGGSISGAYTVTGNNTGIKTSLVKIFNNDVTIAGSWNVAVSYPEWFNVSDAAKTRNAIQKAVNIADHIVLSGDYNVQNSVYNPNEDMYAQRQLIIGGTVTEDYITVGSGKTVEITGKVKATSPLTDLFRVEGDCTVFCGGGIIEGCGVINDYNGAYHYYEAEWKQWKASLIRIYGNDNKIENLNICTPTSVGIYIGVKTEGSAIIVPSRNNNINNCTFSGGLSVHGGESSTYLMAIVTDGSGTVVENNRFVPDGDGKSIYSALFTSTQSSPLPYVFRNNYVEGVLEHAVYSYANGGIIDGNEIINTEDIPLQIFGSDTIITNNNIKTTQHIVSGSIVAKIGIVVSESNNVVRGNRITNYTRSSIRLTDYHMFSEGDTISNNIIEDNIIEPYYGESATVAGIEVDCNYSLVDNLIIRGNTIIGKNMIDNYTYFGAIHINGQSHTIKGVSILDNFIKNIPGGGIGVVSTDTADLGKNVSIVGNKMIDVRNTDIGDTYQLSPISLNGINKAVVSKNSYLSSENRLATNQKFINAVNYDNIVISENTFIWLTKDGENVVESFGKIALVLDDYQKADIIDNYFAGKTKGTFKIATDASSIELNNVGSPIYGNPNKITKITPINDAAITLQNSGNYLYDTRADTVGYGARIRLETKQGQAVGGTDDCLFEWEIVYIGI